MKQDEKEKTFDLELEVEELEDKMAPRPSRDMNEFWLGMPT